jgi:hypothetical protein
VHIVPDAPREHERGGMPWFYGLLFHAARNLEPDRSGLDDLQVSRQCGGGHRQMQTLASGGIPLKATLE